MPLTALITGGAGFLGQVCAKHFHSAGWRVVGIGHGRWTIDEAYAAGYEHWINTSVSKESLIGLEERLDAVVHCAGSGSVAYSFEQPFCSFKNTVGTTATLLEYLRQHAPKAFVLYPSSAAVYGATTDTPLAETDTPNPVSPYGFHKLMVESLLAAHNQAFGQPTIAVRFFSIYGPGLRKQLLWDASRRFLSGISPQTFWGTGSETRDWIYVDDAARLLLFLAEKEKNSQKSATHQVINAANGSRVTVREVLDRLSVALGSSPHIAFNGALRAGDPRFYQADVRKLQALGWKPNVGIESGLANYATWIRALTN